MKTPLEEEVNSVQMITIEKTCDLLNISRPTLHRLIKRGEIPLVKLGRKSLIPLSELQSFVEKLKGAK